MARPRSAGCAGAQSFRAMTAQDTVREMYLAGQRKWPALRLGFDAFLGHYQKVSAPDQTPTLEPDLYLCCACVQAEPEALRLFETEALGVAQAAIRRIDSGDDFVREALQELWNKLLVGEDAKVRYYSGRGPLKAWVRVAATRVALDRRRTRKRSAERRRELTDQLAAADVNVEAWLLKARYGQLFQDALRAAVAALSEQERNVLRMHVVGQCSIDDIGRAYGVHRATAARWIERARAKIYGDVQSALCVEQRLTASEFKSLAAVMGGEAELSLGLASSGGRHDTSQS
jgi:RNA polymerase sigma-70 factor (ECF subfamily)